MLMMPQCFLNARFPNNTWGYHQSLVRPDISYTREDSFKVTNSCLMWSVTVSMKKKQLEMGRIDLRQRSFNGNCDKSWELILFSGCMQSWHQRFTLNQLKGPFNTGSWWQSVLSNCEKQNHWRVCVALSKLVPVLGTEMLLWGTDKTCFCL